MPLKFGSGIGQINATAAERRFIQAYASCVGLPRGIQI
jgi:hypothetical protein